MKYMIQFDLAPYLKEKLRYDFKSASFPYKSDETTNGKVEKQYDDYLKK